MANYKGKGGISGAKSKKRDFSSKKDLNGIRSYWVGVGIALGLARSGNVEPYFESARKRKSMEAGFIAEMSRDRPSDKVNLFK